MIKSLGHNCIRIVPGMASILLGADNTPGIPPNLFSSR